MRQSRDGVIRIIDETPRVADAGFLDGLPDAGETLVWFMRTMACVWVAKGLFNWAVLMGLNPRFGDFTMLPRALQSTIVFFAGADLLAAIGMCWRRRGAASCGCCARESRRSRRYSAGAPR